MFWQLWSFFLVVAGWADGHCCLSGSRKRISVSCERLRALLPQFDGRREDMASVLEMAVQFLRLAGTVVPNQEPHAVSAVPAPGPRGGAAVGHLASVTSPLPSVLFFRSGVCTQAEPLGPLQGSP